MDQTQARTMRPTLHTVGVATAGFVVGLFSSSFGLFVPWVLAVILAVAGLLTRKHPPLLWAAAGIALGAIGYYVLALVLAPLGASPVGSGGS